MVRLITMMPTVELLSQAALLRLHQTNGLTSILMAKPLKASGLSMAKEYYFDENGIQYKGKAIKVGAVVTSTMTKTTVKPVTNRFAQIELTSGLYFGADGYAVTGEQVINGQHLYFDQSGRQVKGAYVTVNGQRRYYDANTGEYVPGR